MAETVVICGGEPAPQDARQVVPLFLSGPNANLSLQLEDIGRPMVAIAAAIRFARDNEIPIAVKGGGHSYAGGSKLPAPCSSGRVGS